MKQSWTVALLVYYLFGQIFLPEGNFAYVEQIPDLYRQFALVNQENDPEEFFEEEFFDMDRFFGADDDDPFEKEAQQVPFHPLPAGSITFYLACDAIRLNDPAEEKNIFPPFPLATEYCVDQTPVFHPPRPISV
jgi:hypothetical protein